MRSSRLAYSILFAFFIVHAPVKAAGTGDLHRFTNLAFDPAGELVATVEVVDMVEQVKEPHGKVVVRKVQGIGAQTTFDPCAKCTYSDLVFSKTHQLAFLATDDSAGTATLYVGKIAIAQLNGTANTPRWSPDGDSIALLATLGAHKKIGATEAGAAQIGEIGIEDDEQRITLVNVKTGAVQPISPADTFVYEFDWVPGGKGFVGTAAKGNGDNNWWIATLDYFDSATGTARIIASPKVQMDVPRVSPDGNTVAFVGGLMSDFGSVGGDIYTVPVAGGEPTNITPGFTGSFNALAWRNGNILASAQTGETVSVLTLDAKHASAPVVHWSSALALAANDEDVQFSEDGQSMATIAEDFTHGPYVLAGSLLNPHAITHVNDGMDNNIHVQSISWKSDGLNVQGWLLGPKSVKLGKPSPMVVIVHGGPSALAKPNYIPNANYYSKSSSFYSAISRDLIAKGYYVFMPNPRGSYGQGEAFTRANVRDFGGGDLRDILAGIDTVLTHAPVDGNRIGLYGHSYGGFMTMWGITHSNRFKAAVAGAGLANWMSYYGENGIDQWMVPFFGATAYDDPAIYRAASPIESIKAAKTPTFIYVGERDVECPAMQSVEFWHGLHANKTPASLVIYEGEGHHFSKPEHIKDVRNRMLAWFDKYL